ncbi:DNA damage response protein-like protein [Hapsidospora chrysogenum ATCC 11550]|uniref:DNA damage response protein-like protein n=1 Tax=Hapsidospora chrysogenum (strain ATCC 11550 / CBS 779.69 / DSM 880 / IAM 14645 / JCM 23072 / IMI 49137) TaxID=857340 RepID=A0A086TAU6_HAPC1|nr:DNA damage response protein-like protein [Hapsidospora chrysogenum ATCC 11550]
MPERDPLVLSYVHLANFPRGNEALHTLRKVASMVKPIMRARGWKVRELAEFYPQQANLLGLNYDHGRKICIRLRYPGDRNQFIPLNEVIDTMLHELCHNVIGPHNAAFHALWNQLRDEHTGLVMKGYTGEGFLSEGRRLGGARIPPLEARRLARESAEKRQRMPTGTGPGRRLGGATARPGEDIRRVIAEAAQRRNETLKGCATEKLSDGQIRDLADTASRNGFRTQAEEDEANEAAIAQALWELVQEDEKSKYGSGYIHPSPVNPAGNGGGSVMAGRPDGIGESSHDFGPPEPGFDGWVCGTCTLHNPPTFLCCDACGAEKPPTGSRSKSTDEPTRQRPRSPTGTGKPPETIDLTGSPPRKRDGKRRRVEDAWYRPAPAVSTAPQTWLCGFCGKEMERQWWTCSLCGVMKDSS